MAFLVGVFLGFCIGVAVMSLFQAGKTELPDNNNDWGGTH
jgi:hypothetical protein